MGIKLWATDKPTIGGLEREIASLERKVFYLEAKEDDLENAIDELEQENHFFKCATLVMLGALITFAILMTNMAIMM